MDDRPAAGCGPLRWLRLGLGLLLLAMVGLNCANSAGRYLFGRAIAAADELLVYSMVAVVFLGTVTVTAGRQHLALDAVFQAGGPRARALARLLGDAVVALSCGYAARQSFDFTRRIAEIGPVSMAAEVPMLVPHAFLTVGLALCAAIAAAQAAGSALALLRRPGPAGVSLRRAAS